MKVFVDELPKDCDECNFAVCDGFATYCPFCQGKHSDHEFVELVEECPLQSLADHDKQVKKEVCEQVKTELLDISHEYWRVFKQNGKQYMTSDDIAEYLDVILDQIQNKGE